MSITHSKVNAGTPGSVVATDWNAAHVIGAGSIGTTELATTGVGAVTVTNANLTIGVDGRVISASNGTGGSGGGITNSAGNNVMMRSNGTNAIASGLSDDGTTVTTTSNRVLTVAASSLADAYPLYIKGPIQIPFTVTDIQNGEIFQMTLVGSNRVGPVPGADVFGIVIRNGVNFDNTSHTNQCGGVYAEATGARTTGSQALTNMAFEGAANNGDYNYSFVCYTGHGVFRFDDGGTCGNLAVTGTISSTSTAAFGATTITGNCHVSGGGTTFIADGTGEFAGNLTCDTNLRVNGYSNLAGGAGLVYLQSLNSSGVPIPVSNAIAFAPGRYTGSGAADPTLGWAIATGSATNLTLANGTKDGQEWALSVKSGTGQVTPAALNGGTKYTWSALGALTLRWDASGTTWCLVSQTGMTLV